MSVYASLGEEAPAIRDTLVARLCADSSPRELVLSILEFISGAVGTQPGLTELFLGLRREDTAERASTEPVSEPRPPGGEDWVVCDVSVDLSLSC